MQQQARKRSARLALLNLLSRQGIANAASLRGGLLFPPLLCVPTTWCANDGTVDSTTSTPVIESTATSRFSGILPLKHVHASCARQHGTRRQRKDPRWGCEPHTLGPILRLQGFYTTGCRVRVRHSRISMLESYRFRAPLVRWYSGHLTSRNFYMIFICKLLHPAPLMNSPSSSTCSHLLLVTSSHLDFPGGVMNRLSSPVGVLAP